MNLELTEEQQMLRESVAKLLQTESNPARVRAAEATGFDPELWQQLLDMGITAMRVPESSGGGGMSLFDAVLVAEQAGKHLASVPLAEALPVSRLLAQLDGQAAARYLADLLEGEVVVLHPRELQDAEHEALLTAASAVIALHGDEIVALRNIPSSPQSNLGADASSLLIACGDGAAVDKQIVAKGPAARAAFLAAVEEWKLLKAAMLVGLSDQALQMAAAYSRERKQFGRAIGSFQGIAHPLADALTEVEGARLLVWHAVWAIANADREAAANISMAWWWATQASGNAVARALHAFGGYGVSLEYDIQLYYRRGKAWALLAGDPQQELYVVADRLWNGEADVPLPDAGDVSVRFGCGRDAEAFGEEVRRYFMQHLTAELKAHAHHSVAGYHPEFHRKLADAGLLFPHWPKEYGGRGKTPFDMAALGEVFEEFNWQRITGPITNQVAQIVMRFAMEEVKAEVLPRFAAGESLACLGFTEPSSGSDVFAAQTRAERDNDEWVIDGQKIFTTAANLADYLFLLARTDPDAAKHAGLTLFLVPMNLPGIEVQAVHTVQDERTNIVYLSHVRVHDRYRIGEVNGGTAVMAATLELEHGGDQYRISFSSMYRHAVRWAATTMRGGQPLLQQADVRRRLARVAVHTTIAKDLCYRCIWATANATPGRAAYGPMSKLFSTEYYLADAMDLMDLAAPTSLFAGKDGLGHVEIGYRQSIGMTIYGGTSEVHRSIIAEQGLGMPKSRT
ncbi:acyl-CoA dehydrogenase [Noviherbaspirillum saxi]|uniref:Acyl-CoA dehydrogenase n=1 Tax=Noviherbaspirillum saxi TaxID=2320863 RepID=A0A3A3FE74_9BURK|nr:acyl-CoA dehydrogenase [Noviherbaspirillum saxi]RJF91671.1 acyl-CoA dehydrogenase [Noviherbaspirillum saxi]